MDNLAALIAPDPDDPAGGSSAQLSSGTVTAVQATTVTLAWRNGSYSARRLRSYAPAVNDVVAVISGHGGLLVLGPVA